MKRGCLIITSVLLVLVAIGVIILFWAMPSLRRHAVRQFVRDAIERITGVEKRGGWTFEDVSFLMQERTSVSRYLPPEWLSDHLILMTNGDWIVYEARSRIENKTTGDMLVAKGSDTKWYYTTWHFCIGMRTLTALDQPGDLAEFIDNYHLQEFNGSPDNSFEHTW